MKMLLKKKPVLAGKSRPRIWHNRPSATEKGARITAVAVIVGALITAVFALFQTQSKPGSVVTINGGENNSVYINNGTSQSNFERSIDNSADLYKNQIVMLKMLNQITESRTSVVVNVTNYVYSALTTLKMPKRIEQLHRSMVNAYNTRDIEQTKKDALMGCELWNGLVAVYSNETFLVDGQFIRIASSMFCMAAESFMFSAQYDEAVNAVDTAIRLDPDHNVTNVAMKAAIYSLKGDSRSLDGLMRNMRTEPYPRRYAFAKVFSKMGYVCVEDPRGSGLSKGYINIVKTLLLQDFVEFPIMLSISARGANTVTAVPLWIGFNQYKILNVYGEMDNLRKAQEESIKWVKRETP